MMTSNRITTALAVAAAAIAGFAFNAAAHAAKPLKVFILAGQSNMEGPANISTFDYNRRRPGNRADAQVMRGADGKPAVRDGVWIRI